MADDTQTRSSHQSEELFVEFANASWRTDDELRSWLTTAGLGSADPSPSSVARELPAFVTLRVLVQSIASRADAGLPPTQDQVSSLNQLMRDGPQHHELIADPGRTAFTVVATGETLDQARSAIALSLARFLAEDGPGRLGLCASETCRWLFVDRSAAGRRRWCDMRICGNRSKVRRHRERARRLPAPGPGDAQPRQVLDTLA
jgi:predicted RNA-binding Zn ribbon-like protein